MNRDIEFSIPANILDLANQEAGMLFTTFVSLRAGLGPGGRECNDLSLSFSSSPAANLEHEHYAHVTPWLCKSSKDPPYPMTGGVVVVVARLRAGYVTECSPAGPSQGNCWPFCNDTRLSQIRSPAINYREAQALRSESIQFFTENAWHVPLLRPYHQSEHTVTPPLPLQNTWQFFDYLEGYGHGHNSWEPYSNIANPDITLQPYWDSLGGNPEHCKHGCKHKAPQAIVHPKAKRKF
eukprot:1143408-Pelagomonas_calceolata.AAC.3